MKIIPLLAPALLAVCTSVSFANVILSDTFSTDTVAIGSPLINSLAIETPQTAGDKWSADNSQGYGGTPGTANSSVYVTGGKLRLGADLSSISTSRGYAKLAAAFDDSALTTPFTLQFDWGAVIPNDTSVSFYIGFGNSAGSGASYVDSALALGFNISGNLTGTSITIKAGTTTSASGGFTYTLTRADTSAAWSATLAITYNPTTQQAEFLVNGASLGLIAYTGAIGGIWAKADGLDANAGNYFTLDNLSVSTIPEPSSIAILCGLGALGFAALRRRR